jgi:hypothetical protein
MVLIQKVMHAWDEKQLKKDSLAVAVATTRCEISTFLAVIMWAKGLSQNPR